MNERDERWDTSSTDDIPDWMDGKNLLVDFGLHARTELWVQSMVAPGNRSWMTDDR
jgi:hypothetical protein